MIRTLALLCLVAAPAFAAFKPDLKVRFDINIFTSGSTSFMHLPLTIAEAISTGWVLKTRPTLPLAIGYESLVMYGPVDDNTVNLFFDVDTTYVYGLQIGLDKAQFTDEIFDWETQGYTAWTAELTNGTTRDYWTIQQYFSSADYLATDAAVRNASRNAKTLIQGSKMAVSGFNGELLEISTNTSVLAASGFTEQACMPFMGHHYYYNMSSSTECTADQLLPWFPLVYSGDLIGIGFMGFGKYYPRPNNMIPFEQPPKLAVQAIVNKGPDCLYEIAASPTVVTMHTYFIDAPTSIFCVFE